MTTDNLAPIFGGVVYWCARINRWMERLTKRGCTAAQLAESGARGDCAMALESLLYLLPLTPESQWAFGPSKDVGWEPSRRTAGAVVAVQQLPDPHKSSVLIWAVTSRGALEELAGDLADVVSARRKEDASDPKMEADIISHLLAASSCVSDFAWHLEHVAHHLQHCKVCGSPASIEEEPGQCLACDKFTPRALAEYWSAGTGAEA